MNFLVDAQLPPALCGWLQMRGYSAKHVTELGLGAASDRAIANLAEQEHLILISKDEDFLTLRLPDRFAFLWLRCGNSTNRALKSWMDLRWDQIKLWLEIGERVVEAR